MARLNCQAVRIATDHPLAPAAKSVLGRVYVQRNTGGQCGGPLVVVAENPER